MESLLQDLVKAFGWSIVDSIWQSGIIYTILFVVLWFTPKLSARTRHNLAFLALCTMCGWFMVTFFGHINFSKSVMPALSTNEFSRLSLFVSTLPETFSQKAEGFFPIIVSAYLVGVLLQLFVIVKGYLFLKKLKIHQTSIVPAVWDKKFREIKQSLKITRVIKFKLSGLVNVPVVVGYLKPIVLFPVSLVSQLDQDQVEAILIHELSHIRRNDYLLNVIKTFIETLLFFNPFVWLAGRFIGIEREHACDDLVLKLSGKPLTYAHALLKLELFNNNQTPAYAMAATGKKQYLYQRIKRITNMKTNYLNTKQQMAALTLAFAGLLSVAWVNPEVKASVKEVSRNIAKSPILDFVSNGEAAKLFVEADTVKKKKSTMKITITDDNGNTKVFNGIDELPDSLKKKHSIYYNGNSDGIYITGNDSLRTTFQRSAYPRYFSPAKIAELKKMTTDMQKEFNSPEAKAKFQKLNDEMQKEFNSPEAQAKWKKFSADMQSEFKTEASIAKWKEYSDAFSAKINSTTWQNLSTSLYKGYGNKDSLMNRVYQYKSGVPNENLTGRVLALTNKSGKNLNGGSLGIDSLGKFGYGSIATTRNSAKASAASIRDLAKFRGYAERDSININGVGYKLNELRMLTGNLATNAKNDKLVLQVKESIELAKSAEYQKLKAKFDKDVEELRRKQLLNLRNIKSLKRSLIRMLRSLGGNSSRGIKSKGDVR